MKTYNRSPIEMSADRMSVVHIGENEIGWKKNELIYGQRHLESEMSS